MALYGDFGSELCKQLRRFDIYERFVAFHGGVCFRYDMEMARFVVCHMIFEVDGFKDMRGIGIWGQLLDIDVTFRGSADGLCLSITGEAKWDEAYSVPEKSVFMLTRFTGFRHVRISWQKRV